MKQNQNKQFWIGRNKQMEEKGSRTKHKDHINTETQFCKHKDYMET